MRGVCLALLDLSWCNSHKNVFLKLFLLCVNVYNYCVYLCMLSTSYSFHFLSLVADVVIHILERGKIALELGNFEITLHL